MVVALDVPEDNTTTDTSNVRSRSLSKELSYKGGLAILKPTNFAYFFYFNRYTSL